MQLFEVPETLKRQEEKLNRIKKERNTLKVEQALDAVARSCDNDENLMEVIVDAAKTYVTEGEISGALKKSYGTWNPPLF